MKSLLRNVKKSYGVWKMSEEEMEEFLFKMMESNRNRIAYEIDDDLFDMCIFDNDGNLLDIDFNKNKKQMYLFFELDIFIIMLYNEVLWRRLYEILYIRSR